MRFDASPTGPDHMRKGADIKKQEPEIHEEETILYVKEV
jgi:hypothetical protein